MKIKYILPAAVIAALAVTACTKPATPSTTEPAPATQVPIATSEPAPAQQPSAIEENKSAVQLNSVLDKASYGFGYFHLAPRMKSQKAPLSVLNEAEFQKGFNGKNPSKESPNNLSYTLGFQVAQDPFFKTLNSTMIVAGYNDAMSTPPKNSAITSDDATKALEEQGFTFFKDQKKPAQDNLKAGKEFLEKNANEPGIEKMENGLQYKVITEGKGPKPKATDTVTVNYKGTLIDGTEFDSSYKRGEPITFPLNGVIPGWTEALQLMPVGSTWELFIPSNLAYGEREKGAIPPNSTLIFDVELLQINGKPALKK